MARRRGRLGIGITQTVGKAKIPNQDHLESEIRVGWRMAGLGMEVSFQVAAGALLGALKKVLGDNFKIERIDAAYITIKEKKFTKFSKEKIEKTAAETKSLKKK